MSSQRIRVIVDYTVWPNTKGGLKNKATIRKEIQEIAESWPKTYTPQYISIEWNPPKDD